MHKDFSTPRHKTNECMQGTILGELFFLREYMRGLYSHSRKCRNYFWGIIFRVYCQKLGWTHSSANTCRACICALANTNNNSWQVIHVLVSFQGICNFSVPLHCSISLPLQAAEALISSTHPSRDVVFSGQILAKKRQKLFLYMTSGSLENKHFGHHVMWSFPAKFAFRSYRGFSH